MNQSDVSKKDNENCNQLDTELIGSYQSIKIGFSKDELASFSKIGKHKRYTAGSIVYNEGDLADSFFIIIDGVAEIFKKLSMSLMSIVSILLPPYQKMML
nr:hypothetical protein [Legionella pneumophila]